MVVTLLTAVLALVVMNFFSFEGSLESRPGREQLQRAVAEGHRWARAERSPVILRFDETTQTLQLIAEDGHQLSEFALPAGSDAAITFYRLLPEDKISETPNYETDEDPIPYLQIEAFGAAMPFMAVYEAGSTVLNLRFDPFSGLSWEKTDVF